MVMKWSGSAGNHAVYFRYCITVALWGCPEGVELPERSQYSGSWSKAARLRSKLLVTRREILCRDYLSRWLNEAVSDLHRPVQKLLGLISNGSKHQRFDLDKKFAHRKSCEISLLLERTGIQVYLQRRCLLKDLF